MRLQFLVGEIALQPGEVPAIAKGMNSLSRVRNSHNFSSNLFRRKDKIDAPGCYSALRHIRLASCVELLRDRGAPRFSYAAQRCSAIAVIARDNDSDKFAAPVLC